MTSSHVLPTSPSQSSTPSKSASNFNLSAMRNRLPRLRSGFIQQATRMEWLDDKNIFAWGGKLTSTKTGSQDSLDDGYFWGRFMSRSGSESSTPFRSRSNSFTMASDPAGLSMTSLATSSLSTVVDSASPSPEQELFHRPTFKIQDMDVLTPLNEDPVNEDEGYADDQGLEIKKKKAV
jgi:glycerol-3-phosphate O-acyltransferase/dihydroxyacetone phosphate acyltransferase